ncbi:ComEC/Rec2 family competence protein [Agrococcus casei]|uniref:ComEC/Rec2 family competence protein n=1 Tax=Agrococcus casei TaxID=343512 RepID=UPI003F92D7F9
MRLDLRLAVPVATAWATISAATVLRADGAALCLVVLAVTLCAVMSAWALRRHPRLFASLLMIAVAGGATLLLAVRWSSVPLTPDDPPERCEVEARLNAGNPLPVTVDVAASECDGDPGPIGEALMLEAELNPQELGFGTRFTADCSTWLFEGTWMLECTDAVVLEQPTHAVLSAAWRGEFQQATAWLPGDGGALLAGLAIGDTSRTDDDLQKAMLDAGLSHLTAVSGANCAIVTGAGFAAAAALGARRGVRVIVAAATLVLFAVLVTPEPSVVRASLMAGIALLGLLRGEPRGALPLIALAVFAALFINPQLALTVGFVLSVLATTGLVVHSAPLGAWLSKWLPTPLALAIAVPAAAQLWCLPMLITLDNGVQPLSVLWNLAAAPAAPIVTVVGLVACIAAQFSGIIGGLIAAIAWPAAAWIGALARLSENLPSVQVPWPGGWIGAVLSAVLVAGALIMLRRQRLGSAVVAAACCLGLLSATVPQVVQWSALRDWRIVQCDVGQGHATLFRAAGQTVLIDTGPDPEALMECLATAHVDRIDALLLTHFDHDHSGAAEAVAGLTSTVVHGPTDADAAEQLHILAQHGVEAVEVEQGQRIDVGPIGIDVLWPPPESDAGNEGSLVLALHADADGVAELIVLGDIGERQQRRLKGSLPPAHAMLAAHHCSRDQDAALYAEVAPPVVLVGVGENTYGHPTPSCLSLIEAAGSAALRTDLLGTIAIMADGTVWSERRAN